MGKAQMSTPTKQRNFLARDLWVNPNFKQKVIPDKKKKQNKELARKKINRYVER